MIDEAVTSKARTLALGFYSNSLIRRGAAALLFLTAMTLCAWCDPVYVITDGAKIRSGLDASAAVVATLNKGAALDALSKEGARWKVKVANGPEGYVSRLQVSATKPSEGGSVLAGLTRAEVTANEQETTQSVQGLNTNSEAMAANGKVCPQCKDWVAKMENESAAINKANVEKFLKDGGIGL